MKILVFSDAHADATTAGYDRFDDIAEALETVHRAAVDKKVDLVFFLGDLCDPDTRRSHRAVGLGARFAFRLWAEGGIPSRWLIGNHDVVEDGAGTSTLSALAGAAEGMGAESGALRVYEGPTLEVFGGLPIVALPYVARSRAYDPAAFVDALEDPLLDKAQCVLVVGHLMLEGIGPGSESGDMARGRDVFFPIETAVERFGERALMLQGHYHRRQVYRGVHVVGSLARLRFDEEMHEPGFLLVEVPT